MYFNWVWETFKKIYIYKVNITIYLIKKNQGRIDRRLLISRGRTGGRLRPQTGPGQVVESVRRFQTTLPLSLFVIVLKVNTNVPS